MKLRTMSESLIAATACLDPIYADGIAGFLDLGENFATVYYRLQPTPTPGGGYRYDKVPVASIIRPQSSILACGSHCSFRDVIMGATEMSKPKVLGH